MKRTTKNKFKKPFYWGVALVNAVLVALFVTSAWGGVINPNTSVVVACLTLMFPILLILMFIALLVTLVWFKKLALLNLAALLLCGSQILDYSPLNFSRLSHQEIAQSKDNLLKVLSYNTFGFNIYGDEDFEGDNPTLEYILNADADIILMQEADGIETEKVDSLQRCKLEQAYPHHDITHRGMAIYSKYPFSVVPIKVHDKAQLDLCRYDVTLPSYGRKITIFNVHMQSIGLTPVDKQLYKKMTSGGTPTDTERIRKGLLSKLAAAFRSRANQADDIRRALNSVGGDVILVGDFNDVPGSYACQRVKGDDMTDAYRQSGFGPAITYHADRFYFRIDHMFYRGDLEAIRSECGDCSTSDHYPLVTTFKLK